MPPEIILETNKLGKSYPSGNSLLTVLSDISVRLEAGATVAIVGPSGSGKSTLLGLCAGLDRPTTGSISIVGQSLNALNEEQLAKLRNLSVGFVFQNFQLIPTLTAHENVMVPLELRGDSSATKVASTLLERVGLRDRLDHYPSQLSGGEQQRVALARAFVNHPRILFADEPTGNLDAETSETVVDLLFELNRSYGTTLVLVTHNDELAARTGRIIRLKGGKVVAG